MNTEIISSLTNSSAWKVFVLFIVPFGGGIPAGVLLAQKYQLHWLATSTLYFVSDVFLAIVFEPLMLGFLHLTKKSKRLDRFRHALKEATKKTVNRYHLNPSPLSLIMITFGSDPMTGRSVAKAAGHGFVVGWLLTITGDMLFFFVVFASTVWLNNMLGDGTITALLITVAILWGPTIVKKAWARVRNRIQISK